MWLKNEPFFLNVARRISTLFYYDSKNWTRFFFFRNYTLRIDLLLWKDSKILLFEYDSKNWFFWIKIIELNFFSYDFKNSTFFQNDSSNWTFFMTQRTELFRYDPKKLNFFVENDSKNWTSFFLQFDSNKWTYLKFNSKNWTFFHWMWFNVFFLQNKRQRIEPFLLCLEELTLFF